MGASKELTLTFSLVDFDQTALQMVVTAALATAGLDAFPSRALANPQDFDVTKPQQLRKKHFYRSAWRLQGACGH